MEVGLRRLLKAFWRHTWESGILGVSIGNSGFRILHLQRLEDFGSRIGSKLVIRVGSGHVLVTFTTGHVVGILLEDSMIRNSSKHKALRFKSHDPSGFSVCPHILKHTGNPEDFQVFSSAGENLSVSNRFSKL